MLDMPVKEQEMKKQMYSLLFGDDGSVTMAEFTRAFEAIIEQILKFEKKLQDKNTGNVDELRKLFAIYKYQLKTENNTELEKTKNDISDALDKALHSISVRLADVKDGKQGPPGPQGEIGPMGLQGDQGAKGEDGAPDTGEDIIKKVNKDKSGKKIKKERVEGVVDVIDWIKSSNEEKSKKMRLYNGGLVATIVAGSGISINSTDPGNPIITATGGFTVKTATGAINASNTSFTFSAEPTIVFVNGQGLLHGGGVTISGTSVTLDNAPGVGGSVWGI